MFVAASQKEQAVRAALADTAATKAVLKSVRQAVVSYESIVRRYPTSSYSDDALWLGGRLALDAFAKFGDVQDRETGVRLLRWLAAEYPSSKFAKQVPGLLSAEDAGAGNRKPQPAAGGTAVSAVGAAGNGPQAAQAAEGNLHGVSRPAQARVNPPPAAAPKLTALTNVQRTLLPDVVRVTIALGAEVAFHDERLAGPERIFIDFPDTLAAASLVDHTFRFEEDRDAVHQIRVGRQSNATTRVVLDAAGISSYSVYPIYNPYRLVIDCVRASPVTPAERDSALASVAPRPAPGATASVQAKSSIAVERVRSTPPIAGRRIAAAWSRTLPGAAPSATSILAAARVPSPLVGHTVGNNWSRSLPNASPAATAAILDARMPAALTSRTVTNGWGHSLPTASPAATAAILDGAHMPATLASRSLTNAWGRNLPDGSPASAARISEALNAGAAPPATAASASISPPVPPPGESPTPAAGSGFSMARQLGLGVSRIVLDPGHGGHDPGAKGKGGITEAELVLDVSLRLEKLLGKVPGLEVILTRRADEFVQLPERTAIANREGADLFLSIHANASPNDQAHGVETYFLNFANNLSAAAVAARENATSGQAMGALPDFVRAIALNNKLDESRDFATLVQQSMVERLQQANKTATVKDLGVKQAPFVVLIGASMPSVLAEISFLTNEQEAKLLKSSAYRQHIAEALFEAVRQYQGSLKRVQTVAHQ
jgi:N-acetylmuramoyl-L-alanine amidase